MLATSGQAFGTMVRPSRKRKAPAEFNYLENKKTLEEVKDEIKLNSRHYAKRQYTFFNHQFNTNWYDVNFENFNETIEKIYNDIKKKS